MRHAPASLAAVVLVVTATAGGACLPVEPVCTLEARASLNVSVVDDDGAPVGDAVVTAAQQGGETKTCEHTGDGGYLCDFFEVAGTFVVTATRGSDSDSASVDVADGECHVVTADVELVLPAVG
jgi:hypothetical protein